VILTRAARGLIRGGAAYSSGLEGRQAALLYFDELQITDPFTAVSLKGSCIHQTSTLVYGLLKLPGHAACPLCIVTVSCASCAALMEELVAEGAVLVITSNRHPSQLTNHGLHEVHNTMILGAVCRLFATTSLVAPRHCDANTSLWLTVSQDLFNHFVETLQQACDVMRLGDGRKDYRRLALSSQVGLFAGLRHLDQNAGYARDLKREHGWQLRAVVLQQESSISVPSNAGSRQPHEGQQLPVPADARH
jgi:hypothetical protein